MHSNNIHFMVLELQVNIAWWGTTDGPNVAYTLSCHTQSDLN